MTAAAAVYFSQKSHMSILNIDVKITVLEEIKFFNFPLPTLKKAWPDTQSEKIAMRVELYLEMPVLVAKYHLSSATRTFVGDGRHQQRMNCREARARFVLDWRNHARRGLGHMRHITGGQ